MYQTGSTVRELEARGFDADLLVSHVCGDKFMI